MFVDATRELIGLCARLPLALRIAAGRVAAPPHLFVVDVVAELTGDRFRVPAARSGAIGDPAESAALICADGYPRTPEPAGQPAATRPGRWTPTGLRPRRLQTPRCRRTLFRPP
ncbi:hypothetical protein [Amycolatopsis sp. cmx-4-83]|uniref:hypothetical protein n=1 Tax=Amycolatopsis sp. cmx-4-83 TaxID=2790940 RepID=UPI00397C7317